MDNCIDNLYTLPTKTLLDEIKIDEVTDDNGDLVSFKLRFELFDMCLEMDLVKNALSVLVKRVFDRLVNADYIKSYSFGKVFENPNSCSFDFGFNVMKGDVTESSFVTVLSYFCYCLFVNRFVCRNDKLKIFLFDDNWLNKMEILFYCDDWIVDTGKSFEKYFGFGDDFERFGSSFVLELLKLGIIHPVDESKSRYLLFDSGKHMMFMFDSYGKTLFKNPVDFDGVYEDVPNYNIKNRVNSSFSKFDDYGLMCIRFGLRKYGFISYEGSFVPKHDYNSLSINGNLIGNISVYFSNCRSFSEGYAAVQDVLTLKWFYIDIKGNKLNVKDYDFFDEAFSFNNGLALVIKDNKKNIIDIEGNVLCKEWYDDIFLSYADENGYYYINKKICVEKCIGNKKFYNYIDDTGKLIWNDKWFSNASKSFHLGYAKVCEGEGLYNFLKEDGTLLFDKWYDDLCGCPYYGVCAYFNENANKWYFMDVNTGDLLFDKMGFDECIWVDSSEKDNWYFYVYRHSDVSTDKQEDTVISRYGEMLSQDEWYDDTLYIENGYVWVKKLIDGKKMAKIVKMGVGDVTNYIEDFSSSVRFNKDGLLLVSRFFKEESIEMYNFMDKYGKFVSDVWFPKIDPMRGGFSIVRKIGNSGKKNVLSWTGKLLVDDKYDVLDVKVVEARKYVIIKIFEDSEFKYGLFDCDGNMLFECLMNEPVEPVSPGILKCGINAKVDYSGSFISLV